MLDTTAYVVAALKDALDVEVSTEIPQDRPRRLIMVAQVMDESDEFLLRPFYELTCWGQSDRDARNIALSALHALADDAKTSDWLSSIEMGGLLRDEWTKTGQARYVMSLSLVFNTDE